MSSLGNIVRLLPLHPDELPAHSSFDGAAAADRPALQAFVTNALTEAWDFTEKTVPVQFSSKGKKNSPPSTAKIELLSRSYSAADLDKVNWQNEVVPRKLSGKGQKDGENWFARRSQHANSSAEGTASWEDFDFGLRTMHSEHEMDYTPDIYDSYVVCSWDNELRALNVDGQDWTVKGPDDQGSFTEIHMEIREMCHKLPSPMASRVFAVLVLTAKGPRQDSLIVVQVPVDIKDVQSAKYSNGRNITEGKTAQQQQKVVVGCYTSIERCQILPDSNIEWVMATASDAKGGLPMWIQKMGMPGAIIKDVGLFLKWNGQRKKGLETRTLVMSAPGNTESAVKAGS